MDLTRTLAVTAATSAANRLRPAAAQRDQRHGGDADQVLRGFAGGTLMAGGRDIAGRAGTGVHSPCVQISFT
jgi:hypothetical protein